MEFIGGPRRVSYRVYRSSEGEGAYISVCVYVYIYIYCICIFIYLWVYIYVRIECLFNIWCVCTFGGCPYGMAKIDLWVPTGPGYLQWLGGVEVLEGGLH